MPILQIKDSTIEISPVAANSELKLPFIDIGISAGFPSPALDFTELSIDLNKSTKSRGFIFDEVFNLK